MIKNICFLSLKHQVDDNRVFHKECRTLKEAGFNVYHLVSRNIDTKPKVINGINIVYFKTGTGKFGLILSLYNLYKKANSLNADCYHCNELESWLIGILIKLFHRNKVVLFDVHEHYPSHFDDPRYPHWLKFWGELFIKSYIRLLGPLTDFFIFAKRSVAPDYHVSAEKQEFIFNYAPLWLKSRSRSDVAEEITQEFTGNPTAIHIGRISVSRGWPELLQALEKMKHKNMDVLLVGGVLEGNNVLMAEAKRLEIDHRIHIKERIPYELMFDFLLCADLGLMLYQPGMRNHHYAFPMKLYDYMLAGLPVIGPDFAIEVTPVVDSEKCGLCIDTSNPSEIARVLDWVCENPSEAKLMGTRGRQAILRRYNWEAEKHKLITVYDTLSKIITRGSK